MISNKKYLLMLLFIILCSAYMIAQTDYYYKGKKIPLIINENKVCVSIPKVCVKTSERILANVKVLNKINDEKFDIFIIPQSDLEKITTFVSGGKNMKSVILTSCYLTEDKDEVFATPYMNVRLKKEQDLDLLTSYAEKYGLKIVKRDQLMPLWYILTITQDSEKNSLECANLLWESGLFAASVPDLCSDNLTCSDDPLFNMQWGLHNSNYTDIDISASLAWNYATGKNVKIAILDSGIDMNHIDLSSNISNLSYDTETGTSPSDTIYGDHGTHCAGIAAAKKDNGIQIAGVAPDATIVSISNPLTASTTNIQLKLANGITWAYLHGVDIISNSWRSPIKNEAIDESIQNAFRYGRNGKGCVIVFASGNRYSNNVSYPANCNDTILVVGAIDSTGVKRPSSNYGTGLDIVAPGDNILSTLPNDSAGYKSGTSMACPHVSGVAALILERNSELTVNQVNCIINGNAKKIPGVNFNVTKPNGLWNNKYGYGLVDAFNSVQNTPSVIYIQNETITGDRFLSADSIYVGKDVTDGKSYGNVTLGQGQINLKAKYVEFKNSTSVPLGTILEIEN